MIGTSPMAILRAEKADLITLPIDITGTNCGNCLYFKKGMCTNPKVNQPVTQKNCCNFWDHEGTTREWEYKKQE